MEQQEMETNINISFNDTQEFACECGNDVFLPVFKFRVVSALISPTGKESMIPVQQFQCTSCGNIPSKFALPNA
jgi:hypothetical protein